MLRTLIQNMSVSVAFSLTVGDVSIISVFVTSAGMGMQLLILSISARKLLSSTVHSCTMECVMSAMKAGS